MKEARMKQKVTVTSVARPWQYKNRAAEVIILSVQTIKRSYKIKNKMKTAGAFIVICCLFVVKVKGELALG